LSENDNEEVDTYVPTDEENWQALPNAQGEDKADILLQLSMSCSPEIEGQPAITMAELAIEIYTEVGLTEEVCADFAFAYVVIAENKARNGDISGAIEAAKKALTLVRFHELNNFQSLPWNLLRWYVISGREAEAKEFLQQLIDENAELALWHS